jgi:hypothetical protein
MEKVEWAFDDEGMKPASALLRQKHVSSIDTTKSILCFLKTSHEKSNSNGPVILIPINTIFTGSDLDLTELILACIMCCRAKAERLIYATTNFEYVYSHRKKYL